MALLQLAARLHALEQQEQDQPLAQSHRTAGDSKSQPPSSQPLHPQPPRSREQQQAPALNRQPTPAGHIAEPCSEGLRDPTLSSMPPEKASQRRPVRFVGMSGLYNIAKHYENERARGVHKMSPMARAMGGKKNFAALSPSIILHQVSATTLIP